MGQMNYHMPCPECGEMVEFDMLQALLHGAKEGACPACGATINLDSESIEMEESDESGDAE